MPPACAGPRSWWREVAISRPRKWQHSIAGARHFRHRRVPVPLGLRPETRGSQGHDVADSCAHAGHDRGCSLPADALPCRSVLALGRRAGGRAELLEALRSPADAPTPLDRDLVLEVVPRRRRPIPVVRPEPSGADPTWGVGLLVRTATSHPWLPALSWLLTPARGTGITRLGAGATRGGSPVRAAVRTVDADRCRLRPRGRAACQGVPRRAAASLRSLSGPVLRSSTSRRRRAGGHRGPGEARLSGSDGATVSWRRCRRRPRRQVRGAPARPVRGAWEPLELPAGRPVPERAQASTPAR